MKLRTLLSCLLLVVAVGYWVTACVSSSFSGGNDLSHNAVIGAHSIELPGTALSEDDHQAMNAILARHHKEIFKIQNHEHAVGKEKKGRLSDVFVSKRAASQAATNVTKPGFAHDAIQIGVGEKPAPGGSVNPLQVAAQPTPGGSSVPQRVDASPTPAGSSVPQAPRSSIGMVIGNNNPQVSTELFNESADLVRELEPILSKYSGKK